VVTLGTNGPGLDNVGAVANYDCFSDAGKFVLSILMSWVVCKSSPMWSCFRLVSGEPTESPGRFVNVSRTVHGIAVVLFGLVPSTLGLVAQEEIQRDAPPNTEPDSTAAPLPAEEVAATMTLPDGFRATVFASEPDVRNPIAMTWDARGRLWVAENYTYAERAQRFDLRLRDRVLIFEDLDRDGRFDERKVFTDEVQMLGSVELGHGGVWLMCPPRLLFFPDRDGDDRPDGPAEVLLDGFNVPQENHHTFANGLRFGPDGWLYGRCGASSIGEIGPPGATAEQRIPIRGGLWRFHPQRKVVEVLTSGTTNPWGHDWNAQGELFFINTVNGHLWHAFPGAHFTRPHTIDPNPRVYELIDQHADHYHFDTKQDWSKSRDGAANSLGGGHAHVGMTIYQGDNWPPEYRGRLFTLNLHGRRANQEILERHGSGYIGKHAEDLFVVPDPFFRGMELSDAPDGSVMVLDWSDTGECHEANGVHRTSGRIYKLAHGESPRRPAFDLAAWSSAELVESHRHSNEWFVRQARKQLAHRAVLGDDLTAAAKSLRELFFAGHSEVETLRALWTLYVIDAIDETFLREQLRHSNEHVRAWAIRLLTDAWPLDTVLSQRPATPYPDAWHARSVELLVQQAREEQSALVRLVLAATLQRLPIEHRQRLATALVRHAEDTADHNLPLLVWYGLIPVAAERPGDLPRIFAACEWPLTRKFIARRLAEEIEARPAPLSEVLEVATSRDDLAPLADVIDGLSEALQGWRKANPPRGWSEFVARASNSVAGARRDRLRDLEVLFGDGRALREVREVALNDKADLNSRKAALQTLIDARAPELRAICEKTLSVRFLNPIAARGLALFDDPQVAEKLVASYRSFHPTDRPQLLATLVSRPTFATALLEAIATGKIPRADVSAFHARQMQSLGDEKLLARLTEVWGEFRDSPEEKRKLIAQLKAEFTPVVLATADKSQGRAIFKKLCATCHRLYGEGNSIGPDLTGSNRDNLDYLLDNIIDPSAVVTADFRMSVLSLADGRVLNGLILAKTDRTLTLRTATETVTVERSEIEEQTTSPLSLMPDNQLQTLTAEQRRDLIAYLMTRTQVPLPPRDESNDPK
jgi:putative membrane-bound dehydrogenase-like protein